MSEVRFLRPTDELVTELSDNMVKPDRIEVMLSHGHTPRGAIESGLKLSKFVTVGCADEDVCCIFGVSEKSLLTREGIPWMLTTGKIQHHKKDLMIHSVKVVEEMRKHFDHLENHVYVKNRRSIKWLQYLGFKFDEPVPFGKYQQPFMRFYWEK
jgi:hypothetical protein